MSNTESAIVIIALTHILVLLLILKALVRPRIPTGSQPKRYEGVPYGTSLLNPIKEELEESEIVLPLVDEIIKSITIHPRDWAIRNHILAHKSGLEIWTQHQACIWKPEEVKFDTKEDRLRVEKVVGKFRREFDELERLKTEKEKPIKLQTAAKLLRRYGK